jgi:class 3 adenylate cyclase/tetratricopeptide (TPR) repeat protein
MAEELELPEGPVTVMFTDIESSTKLRTSLGDAAADALFREHDELIRAQIAEHRGHDLQAALGDGFLAIFVSTRRAVACAVTIQQELERFNRERAGPALRVRIGLNTGEVAWQAGQPSGEAVHAAARVCAAASGGEVFVSDVTRQLAGTMPDVAFTDRGEFDLKGFPHPWKLWSLAWRAAATDVAHDVFVGREAELAQLRTHLREALDGRGSVVLVGGEPGVGKTSLVRQLIKEAQQQGAVALFGRCYESEGTVPYSPFVETTEQILELVPPEWVREDLGDAAAEVARMVPALRQRFPDIGEPLDLPPEQQRRYFFNAITDFITRGSARLPLLLVADDVHWADEATLLLIEHAAAHIKELHILAIGTYRDVELDVSRPLAATLERLLRNRDAVRVAVKRFDRAGVARILDAHAGRPVPDLFVDAVFSETEGNPFFVDEVFRHLVEEGKVFDEKGEFRTEVEIGELDVPESVRLVVGRRIQRLGPTAQRILAAGAIVGRGFEFGLIERVAEVDVATLLDIFDEAESARVIVPEDRGGEIFYTFGHELIRQTLLTSLSSPRRQRLHLAVADAIEALDPTAAEQRPSEIAHHLLQAGAMADPARTIDYLRRAADRAFEAAAFEEVGRAVEPALDLLGPDAEMVRAELLERLGWAERALGRFERCIDIWTTVVDSYVQLGEPERAGRLVWETAYQLIWMARFEDAANAYARGLEIVGDRPVAERALLVGGLGTLLAFGGLFDASTEYHAEAEKIARDLGDDRELGRLFWGRCVSLWSNGRTEEAVAAGRLAVEHLERAGDEWTIVDALGWLSFPLALIGEHEEARRYALDGIARGEKVGHQAGAILAVRGTIMADIVSGVTVDDWTERARDDLRGMESIDSPWVSQSHAWLAIAHTLRGDLDEGRAEAEIGVIREPVSAWSGVAWGYRFLNRAYAGDEDACRQLLAEQREALDRAASTLTSGGALMLLTAVEGMAMLGWVEEVRALYPAIVNVIEPVPVRVFDFATSSRVAGMAAVVLGEWQEAEQHFETAVAQAEALPNRFDEPIIRLRFAQMLAARGQGADLDRARELIARAVDGLRAAGMRLLLAEAEQLAATLENA